MLRIPPELYNQPWKVIDLAGQEDQFGRIIYSWEDILNFLKTSMERLISEKVPPQAPDKRRMATTEKGIVLMFRQNINVFFDRWIAWEDRPRPYRSEAARQARVRELMDLRRLELSRLDTRMNALQAIIERIIAEEDAEAKRRKLERERQEAERLALEESLRRLEEEERIRKAAEEEQARLREEEATRRAEYEREALQAEIAALEEQRKAEILAREAEAKRESEAAAAAAAATAAAEAQRREQAELELKRLVGERQAAERAREAAEKERLKLEETLKKAIEEEAKRLEEQRKQIEQEAKRTAEEIQRLREEEQKKLAEAQRRAAEEESKRILEEIALPPEIPVAIPIPPPVIPIVAPPPPPPPKVIPEVPPLPLVSIVEEAREKYRKELQKKLLELELRPLTLKLDLYERWYTARQKEINDFAQYIMNQAKRYEKVFNLPPLELDPRLSLNEALYNALDYATTITGWKPYATLFLSRLRIRRDWIIPYRKRIEDTKAEIQRIKELMIMLYD